MYHYMEFDPYLIRERNRQIFREVQALRLEERLRENRMGGSRLFTFSFGLKSTLNLLRRACRAVVQSEAVFVSRQPTDQTITKRRSSERNSDDRLR